MDDFCRLAPLSVSPAYNLSKESLKQFQRSDNVISQVYDWKQANNWLAFKSISSASRALKHYWIGSWNGNASYLTWKFWRRGPSWVSSVTLEPTNKILEKIRQSFYFSKLWMDVDLWIRSCDTWQNVKCTRLRGQLKSHIEGLPWERIAIDVAGPFPQYPIVETNL